MDNIKEFPVVVYGDLEQYNEVLSKGRCRIFYKYFNRNGTYITDEFAEHLISTIPYAPVKGIYSVTDEDYTNHGQKRDEGRIYGIVPENPNFAWETHMDEDGVMREYACVDVYLFTGIYQEANEIVGKAQSMELYEPSIKGSWMTIEGRRAYVYTDGCFLGLQVLGEDVEPCFEGAAFFSLYDKLIDTYNNILNVPNNEGGNEMPNINFRLSDDKKCSMLFDLLNPNYNEENNWELKYMICDVYDEYAVAFEIESCEHKRVYYTKNDETDSVELGEIETCFIVDVTESEKQALTTIQALNGGTYEKIDETFSQVETLTQQNTEFEQKIAEQDEVISTLTSERDESNDNFSKATEKIEALNNEVQTLQEYKLQKETSEKEAIIDKYTTKVNEEILTTYREKIADFTVEELNKELAFELVNSNPSIFSLEVEEEIIPKNHTKDGLEALLDGYENR